jgi:serine/threonine-protein kinase TTK/MPS1
MIYGNPPFHHISGGPLAKMTYVGDPKHRIEYPEVAVPKLGAGQPNPSLAVTVLPSAIDSMKRCLMYRKEQRLTIPELLQHDFLRPKLRGEVQLDLC